MAPILMEHKLLPKMLNHNYVVMFVKLLLLYKSTTLSCWSLLWFQTCENLGLNDFGILPEEKKNP